MSDRHAHFSRDAKVEVFSTEVGSYGTRYEATLLDSLPPRSPSKRKKPCKLPVEYLTLLSDEDESRPLREFVDLSLLRPPPPAELSSPSEGFQLYDVVDAYYKDGWWEGIVNALLGGDDRYSVCVLFQNPSDQIPFPSSHLRLHLDWVDGNWVRPEKKRLSEMIFSSGAVVEVNLRNGVGIDYAWIPAKVLEETENNSYLVKYESSTKSVAGEHQLAAVDIQHIRPVPPSLENNNVGLLDKVEAFFDFSWQGGLVTKLFPNKRYLVFFKERNLVKDLSHSELRLPMIWKDGKWFTGKDALSMVPAGQQEHERKDFGFKNGQKSELSTPRPIKKLKEGHEEVLLKCQPKEQLRSLASLTTTPCYGYGPPKESVVDDLSSPHAERPLQERKKEFIVENESAAKIPLKMRGRPRKFKSIQESATDKKNNGNGSSAVDMAVEHLKSNGAKTDKKVEGNSGNGAGELSTPFPGKRGSPATMDTAEKEQVMKEVDMLVCPRLTSGASLNSRLNVRRRSRRSKVPVSRWCKEAVDEERYSPLSNPNGKRGRKPSLACPNKKNKGNAGGNADMAVDHSKSDGAKTDTKNDRDRDAAADNVVLLSTPSPDKKNDRDRDAAADNVVLLSTPSPDKNDIIDEDAVVAIDSGRVLSNSSDETNVRDPIVSADCSNMFSTPALDQNGGDQAAAADDGGMLSTPIPDKNGGDLGAAAGDGGILSTPVPGLDPQSIVRDEELETPVIRVTEHNAQVQNEICFAKKSPFWKQFEAMPLFRKMPQNPHFNPLKDCKEAFREGRAVGYMMGLIDLAEQISGLKVDDPVSIFDNLLESLCELEAVGFDVKTLQAKVSGLLTVKHKKNNLLNQTQEVEKQLVGHERTKAECDEKENELEKAMKELKEKYTSIVMKKKSEESEISVLRSRIAEMKEIINRLGDEFESVSC